MLEEAGHDGEMAALVEIGRALLEAPLGEDAICELIYRLAGRIVDAESFQLGLLHDNHYHIKVWVIDGQRQPPASFALPEGQGIIRWLETERRPLLVRDFQQEMDRLPARPTYISDRPPRSAIFVPMLAGDRVIGAIALQSQEPNAFAESQMRLLSVLANQSAAALSNAWLYERGQRRLNALMAVSEVGRKIASILDLDELLTQVVESIRSRFGYYHVQVFLVQHGSDRAQFRASTGHKLNEKWISEGRNFTIGREGMIGWVTAHGQTLLANDVAKEPLYIPDDPRLLPDTRAEIAVPLIVEGEVLGVLDVQSTEPDAFSPDDRFILETLADQVAVAVNSARAYEAQREEAWVTTVLLQVAAATSRAENMEDTLEATVRVTAMLVGATSCIAWLWSDERAAFGFGAAYGLRAGPDGETDSRTALSLAPRTWDALKQLRDEQVPLIMQRSDPSLPESLRRSCAGDVMALIPMLNRGETVGILGVSYDHLLEARLTERRLAMLAGIARQAAAAVDNARLAAAREEEAWISTLLLQVSEIVRSPHSLDMALEQVARLVPPLTGVDRCAILLRDAQGVFHATAVYADDETLADAYAGLSLAPGELELLDDACRLGQPLVVDMVTGNPHVPASWEEDFGSRTLLVMPLVVADESIGAMLVDDVHDTHVFSPRRVHILNGIATQAAVAVENIRLQARDAERALLARELELAREIQSKLLPQAAPRPPGYEIAYRWRSAREVGGDFFDFISLDGGRIGLVIADVSDKGIPAALYMMFARTLLRAAALGQAGPAAVLERANEMLLADSDSDMFVTAYYAVLDPASHHLVVASAGHNLAVYAPGNYAEPAALTTPGIPLGIIAPAGIQERHVALAPGDVIVLYTDGVSEAFSPAGDAFGEERLMALVREHCSRTASEIAAAVSDAVHDFIGTGTQSDDLALIVLKRG
jgi:serine phosphatase RsbU (regulator of sigma subunit)/putative methionine-R-sulfoxide reductase with GAF domain